jgi:hypothetical protein
MKKILLFLMFALFCLPWVAKAQQTLPYSYGFETDLATDGWVLQGATSAYTGINAGSSATINAAAIHTGSSGFLFNYAEQNAYLLSPIITNGDNGFMMTFYYKEYSAQYGNEQFQVGYTTDETVTDASLFTYGNEVTASTDWQAYTYTFPAGTKRIAVKYIYTDSWYLFLDDFSFDFPPSCSTPNDLTINYTGGTTAEVSWTSGNVMGWNIDVNGHSTAITENPYTLNNLDLGTTYEVKVQAICGLGELSEWSATKSFTTDLCMPEDQCQISYVCEGSYYGTWFNAGINVVDVESGMVLATLTCMSTSGTTGTLNVCDGRALRFEWVAGSSDEYASQFIDHYAVYDANGVEILSGDGAVMSSAVNYTVNCPSCFRPSDIAAADITATSAELSWEGTNDSYILQYRTALQTEALYFNDFNDQSIDGWTYNGTWIYGFQDPIYNVPGENNYFLAMGWNSTSEETIISSELPAYEDGAYVEFYYFGYNTANTFQVGYSTTTNDASAFTWSDPIDAPLSHYTLYQEPLGTGVKYVAWKATASEQEASIFIDDFGVFRVAAPAGEWITVTADETTVNLTDLEPETDYEVQVKGACGEEWSVWSNTFAFTTLPTCEIPTELDVDEVTTTSAVVTWTSEATSFDIEVNDEMMQNVTSPYTLENLVPGTVYSVRVRANCGDNDYSDWTSAGYFYTLCESFALPYEYGFETDDILCWSYASASSNNGIGRINMTSNDLEAYDGDYAFLFSSNNEDDAYDQILISPEFSESTTENGVHVQFAYKPMTVYYGNESFVVGYSTTTDDIDAFIWDDEEISADNPDEWTLFNKDYPAGTKYVAVYYTSEYLTYLFLDGFSFTEPVACEPIVLTEDDPTEDWTFEGLTEETTPATGVTLDCWTWTRTVDLPENYEYEADELPQLYYNSEFASGGDYSLRLWTRGVYAMPMLDETVDIQRVKMSFSSRHSFSLYTMMVGVMTNPNDPTTFEPVAYVDNGSSTGVEFFKFDFSNYTGTGRYIAFKNVRRAAGELDADVSDVHSVNYIDNIVLELMPATTCTIELSDLPCTENFDGITSSHNAVTGASPRCWELVKEDADMTLTTVPQVYYGAGYAQSGSYSLRMLNRGVYAMPALSEDLDIQNVQLSMYVRQPKQYYQLEVGVWNEADSTFVPVALVNNSTTGMEYFTCDFANYDGNGRRIAFRNTLGSNKTWDYSYNYIDDVVLSAKGACQEITESYTESFETVISGVERAETNMSPSCWEVVDKDVEMSYTGYPQVYYNSSYAQDSDYSLRMTDRCVYAMPELAEGVELGSLRMNLSVLQPNTYYQLEVGVWDGTAFTVVETINNPDNAMTPVTVDFTGYESGRIALRNTLGGGKTWNYSYNYIDNITFEANTGAKNETVAGGVNNAMDSERYLENIAVYPNPTTGELYIDAVDVQKVECYSQMGQLVGVYDNVNELNISELADGVYMLRITVPQGVTMRKVVKR